MPASVADEIHRRGLTDVTAQALQNNTWIIRIEDPPIPRIIQAWDLGEGESAVIAWAYIHPVAPQLTVVMNTTALQDAGLHVRAARAVSAVSTEAVAQETTAVLGWSNNDR